MPPNYDGEKWRAEKVSEYYGKVAQAEEINRKITAAKSLVEGLESRVATIKAESEVDKQSKKNAFDRQRSEGREFIQFFNQKVEKTQGVIDGVGERLAASEKDINQELTIAREKANSEYQRKRNELKAQYDAEIESLELGAFSTRESVKKTLDNEATTAKEEIAKCKNSLAVKEQELLSVDTLEEQAISAIEKDTVRRIETEKAKAGNVKEDSGKELIDIEPLQAIAEKVANMQSYLREFDRMDDMIKTKIAPRQELAQTLTARIETARTMPMELLKVAAVPIPEIAVDGDGKIRIGKTLLDGLSEGEQLELAFRVAKAQASQLGDLKVLCVDGIDKVNKADREWLESYMATDDFQYFLLSTCNGNLSVKIEGEI